MPSLLAPEEEETELCKSIKAHILEYLNIKYSEQKTSDLLDIASLPDPRFRASYIAKERLEGLKCTAVQEAEALLRDQGGTSHELPGPAAEPQLDEPPAKKRKTLSSFFKKSTPSCTTTVTTREAVENELSSYIDSEANPLQWWKDHEVAFPALSCLAKKYLCVPATSSPSERVFSCSGNIVTCHRASLNPDTVDRLVFLARNVE
ncbi:E3 SUMO-protein ligase ZBED1-like [Gadus macrocephalus]|uniref:E3 SUMO-protein ligase ZBED1-like n=1 Tax=Gadus macrocephalus TaxID=80720 RepID=UPI0028CB1610|nr:E3 SUMO-protein ligase ZBED1-like [Gadus macrocephalus]